MELRAPRIAPSRYPYYDTEIICPLCGKRMTTGVMHANRNRRIIGCFGENGCEQYAVKSYLVDAAMLEAYNTLEVEGIKRRDSSAQIMREMKTEQPTLDKVHYYWLDDLVERVEFEDDDLKIFWKCGLESRIALHTPKGQMPERIAASYRASRERPTA